MHVDTSQPEPGDIWGGEEAGCFYDSLCDRMVPENPHPLPAGNIRVWQGLSPQCVWGIIRAWALVIKGQTWKVFGILSIINL